jgi:hypothetical protein
MIQCLFLYMVRNKALMGDNSKPRLQRTQSHSFVKFHIIPSSNSASHQSGIGMGLDGDLSNSVLSSSSFHTSFNKPNNIVFVYMLEKFLEKEFKDKLGVSDVSDPEFEQDFLESVQNIIMYINLKLIKPSDIVIEYGEIKKVAKITVKDGVFVYDAEKYPILRKKLRSSNPRKDKKVDDKNVNSKLKRILTS